MQRQKFVLMVETQITENGILLRLPLRLLSRFEPTKGPPLTRMETEVFQRVMQGYGNKEIANEVNISLRTVKFHVASIFRKYDVKSRTELLRLVLH